LIAPDQTIAQMWSNGARGGSSPSPHGSPHTSPRVLSRMSWFLTQCSTIVCA